MALNRPIFGSTVSGMRTAGNPTGLPAAFSSAPPSNFSINPGPQAGSGAYGAVPGALGLPDPYGEMFTLSGGNLGGINSGTGAFLKSQSEGVLSPETIAAIQDAGARFGVSSGMPGTGSVGGSLVSNANRRNIGRTAEDAQRFAVAALPGYTGALQNQRVNDSLQLETANRNSINRAAPNPGMQASAEQAQFDKYLNSLSRGGGGSSGGGSRSPAYSPSPAGGTGSYYTPEPYNGAGGWGKLTSTVPGGDPFGGNFGGGQVMVGLDGADINWDPGTDGGYGGLPWGSDINWDPNAGAGFSAGGFDTGFTPPQEDYSWDWQ